MDGDDEEGHDEDALEAMLQRAMGTAAAEAGAEASCTPDTIHAAVRTATAGFINTHAPPPAVCIHLFERAGVELTRESHATFLFGGRQPERDRGGPRHALA